MELCWAGVWECEQLLILTATFAFVATYDFLRGKSYDELARFVPQLIEGLSMLALCLCRALVGQRVASELGLKVREKEGAREEVTAQAEVPEAAKTSGAAGASEAPETKEPVSR